MEHQDNKTPLIAITITFIVFIIILLVFVKPEQTETLNNNTYTQSQIDLVNTMNNQHIIYYYSPDCHWCIEQEKIINRSALKYKVNILEDTSRGITATPTFELNNQLYVGYKTEPQLWKLINNKL